MKSGPANKRGFALVIVLTLLAVLVLVTYAISLVGRIDTQMGSTTVYQISARQNALLGMRLSLAAIQQSAGSLTAVTGTADVLSSSLAKNSRWSGVWSNATAAPVWLVSGGVEPATFNPAYSFGPDIANRGPSVISSSVENIVLVGNGSTNTITSRYLEGDAVLVPRVSIPSSSGGSSGHYAYWVGDEGVKLTVKLPGTNPPAPPAPDTFAISLIQYSWTPDQANVPKAISYEQLTEAGAGATTIKNTFHSATLLHGGFLDNSTRRDGLFNVNTPSTRVWRGVVGTFDAGTSDTRKQNFANEILAGFGAGPYRTVAEFSSSPALQDAVGRLSNVTVSEFLSVMGEWFAVRSDTFRIRAYGDALNPADTNASGATPEAVAYCEAIVQRTNQDDPLGNGKKFVITYFRWLGPDDI